MFKNKHLTKLAEGKTFITTDMVVEADAMKTTDEDNYLYEQYLRMYEQQRAMTNEELWNRQAAQSGYYNGQALNSLGIGSGFLMGAQNSQYACPYCGKQ